MRCRGTRLDDPAQRQGRSEISVGERKIFRAHDQGTSDGGESPDLRS